MTPIKHPSNNAFCHPPAGWDDRGGQLRLPGLHATKGKLSDVEVVVTFWEPTPDEIAMLLAGGSVQLTCIGGQPACQMSVLPPNESQILLPH